MVYNYNSADIQACYLAKKLIYIQLYCYSETHNEMSSLLYRSSQVSLVPTVCTGERGEVAAVNRGWASTDSKLLASWQYPCGLAGQTLSPLRVCPARLVLVRVAVASWISGQLAVCATAS